jgi:hypothetical protein
MSVRATEKIMEALSQLLEGFAELQDSLDSDLDDEIEDDEESEVEDDDIAASTPEMIVLKHLKSAIEAVIETDDFAPEEIANLIAALTEALEEVDPNIFSESESDEDEEEEEDDDEDLDDEDLDFDDDDLDDEDLEEDEDEEEDDDDDDEDEDEAPRKTKGRRK